MPPKAKRGARAAFSRRLPELGQRVRLLDPHPWHGHVGTVVRLRARVCAVILLHREAGKQAHEVLLMAGGRWENAPQKTGESG